MSIKVKFLFITSILLVGSSLTIFLVNRDIFEKDKNSYLYSTALDRIENESLHLQSSFRDRIERLRTTLYFFDESTGLFSPQFKRLALQEKWGRTFVYRIQESDLILLDQIGADNGVGAEIKQRLLNIPNQEILTEVKWVPSGVLQVFFRKEELFIYGEMNFPQLKEVLNKTSMGFYIPKTQEWHFPALFTNLAQESAHFLKLFSAGQKSGVLETQWKGRKYLVSFQQVPLVNLYIFEIYDKDKVFAVVKQTMNKTLLVSVLILALGLFAMFLGVSSLTQNLSTLAEGMTQFIVNGTGKPLKLRSKDEVGRMAQVFNTMLMKIESLLHQTAQTARMEAELETAKEVQYTLLPQNEIEKDHYIIQGYYQPASECGGDLWFYHSHEEKIFIFVGDATGHGVSAALITAAARSVLSLSVDQDIWDPARILGMLNGVLCDLAKGGRMMTAFACVYEVSTQKLTYSSASHEIPFLSPAVVPGKKITKHDLIFLTDANGKRLGEDRGHHFKNSSLIVLPSQLLMIYTDGVSDAINNDGKAFGERKLLKTVLDSFSKDLQMNGHQKHLHRDLAQEITNYIDGASQPDDITFVTLYLKSRPEK